MSKYRYENRTNKLADGNKIKFSDLNTESLDYLRETKLITRLSSDRVTDSLDEFVSHEFVAWKVVAHGNPGAAVALSQDIDFRYRLLEIRIYFQPGYTTYVPNLAGDANISAYYRIVPVLAAERYYQGDQSANICHAFLYTDAGGTSTAGPRAEFRTAWGGGGYGSGTIAIWTESGGGSVGDLMIQCTAQATNLVDRTDHSVIVWVKASGTWPAASTSTRKFFTSNLMDNVGRTDTNKITWWQARSFFQDYMNRNSPSVKITDEMSNTDKTLGSSIKVWSSTTVRANATVLHIPEYDSFDWRGRFIWVTGCFKIASNGEFIVGSNNDRNIKAAYSMAYGEVATIQGSDMRLFEGCFFSQDGAATAAVNPRLYLDFRTTVYATGMPVVQMWVSNAEPNVGQLLIYRSSYASGDEAEDESNDNVDMAMLIEASPDLRV